MNLTRNDLLEDRKDRPLIYVSYHDFKHTVQVRIKTAGEATFRDGNKQVIIKPPK